MVSTGYSVEQSALAMTVASTTDANYYDYY